MSIIRECFKKLKYLMNFEYVNVNLDNDGWLTLK